MHLTVPSNWSRSIGTGGRDPSERVVTIAGMRTLARVSEAVEDLVAGLARNAEIAAHLAHALILSHLCMALSGGGRRFAEIDGDQDKRPGCPYGEHPAGRERTLDGPGRI